jgi:hypothetical protein
MFSAIRLDSLAFPIPNVRSDRLGSKGREFGILTSEFCILNSVLLLRYSLFLRSVSLSDAKNSAITKLDETFGQKGFGHRK